MNSVQWQNDGSPVDFGGYVVLEELHDQICLFGTVVAGCRTHREAEVEPVSARGSATFNWELTVGQVTFVGILLKNLTIAAIIWETMLTFASAHYLCFRLDYPSRAEKADSFPLRVEQRLVPQTQWHTFGKRHHEILI